MAHGHLEDTRTRYRLLCDTTSTERVTMPSRPTRADCPTLVQALEHYILRCFDQRTRPLPPTVLVQQSVSIGISRLDHANTGTSDIGIKPRINCSLINGIWNAKSNTVTATNYKNQRRARRHPANKCTAMQGSQKISMCNTYWVGLTVQYQPLFTTPNSFINIRD